MSDVFAHVEVFVTGADGGDADPHFWFLCTVCNRLDGHAMPQAVPQAVRIKSTEFARWSLLFASKHAECV